MYVWSQKEIIDGEHFKRTQSSHVYTQLNTFKYSYLELIILFNINHLFAHGE